MDQDEVETQLTPDTKKRRRELADRAAEGDTQVNYAQFADLYKQWRSGLLLDKQVINRFGPELPSYFEAQFALADIGTPVERNGDGVCPLQPLEPHGYPPVSRYERVYELWRDGWVVDQQVLETLGSRVLEMMARQRLRGELPISEHVPRFEGQVIRARLILPDDEPTQPVEPLEGEEGLQGCMWSWTPSTMRAVLMVHMKQHLNLHCKWRVVACLEQHLKVSCETRVVVCPEESAAKPKVARAAFPRRDSV